MVKIGPVTPEVTRVETVTLWSMLQNLAYSAKISERGGLIFTVASEFVDKLMAVTKLTFAQGTLL